MTDRRPGATRSLGPMDAPVAEHVVGRPAPALAPFVAAYTGYRMAGFPPGLHAGLPSRHLTFIVSLDRPVDCVRVPDPTRPPEAFSALLGGLHTSPALIRHDGHEHGVQLQLTPLGSRALLGCPAGAMASTVVHLDAVLGSRAAELQDRLTDVGDWPGRFAVLDEVLTATVRDHRHARPEVERAWALLGRAAGAVGIEAVAAEVGWSRRHLAHQFRAEYGLTPKAMARVMRFERAKRLLTLPTAPSLSAIAVACGYADQAHFTREWKDHAGASPTAWLDDEVLIVAPPTDPDLDLDGLGTAPVPLP